MTHTYAFWSFASDVRISYLPGIAKKWQLEPYFYLGLRSLISPVGSACPSGSG